MFMVYWMEVNPHGDAIPVNMEFKDVELSLAIKFMENLRKNSLHHVVMSSENPNSVGKPGVAETDSTYDWKKRRK